MLHSDSQTMEQNLSHLCFPLPEHFDLIVKLESGSAASEHDAIKLQHILKRMKADADNIVPPSPMNTKGEN